MTTTIKNFGLYGREESTVSPEFFHLVSIDASCRKHNWVIKPHFHSKLYQFFFIESGSGDFIFNEKSKPFSGKNVIVMPDNNLHGFQFSEDIKGFTLSVSSYIIDNIVRQDKELGYEINRVRLINMNTNQEDFNYLMRVINSINRELHTEDVKVDLSVKSLLTLLLVKIFRIQTKEHLENNIPTYF